VEQNVRVVVDQSSETVQVDPTESPSPSDLPFRYLASGLDQLLETVRRELDGDRNAAKASLDTVSHILKSEIERQSGANGSKPGALAGWQIVRVRAYIEENLHRNIETADLGAIARRSRAHFSRAFKQAFGEPPHAYVLRRRLERACHLMVTSSESLSEIALSVGLADQPHLCKVFRRAFGQSPSIWRREHETRGSISRTGMGKCSIITSLDDSANKHAATVT
jgi:AraC family transcriptional regulator